MMNMKRRNSRSKTFVRSPNRLKEALRRLLRPEALERREMMSADGFNPYHNYDYPVDTNYDGHINAMDALLVINALNSGGAKPLNPDGSDLPRGKLLDVNADGNLNAMDALGVINKLGAEGLGELARLTLSRTDMAGNVIPPGTQMPVNMRFRLVTSVQDLRTDAEGVFSIGTNILNSSPSTIRLLVGESQLLRFAPEVTGGTFTLSYNGQTTAPITFSGATLTMVTRLTTALKAIIPEADFKVRVGPPEIDRSYLITFRNNLLDTNISEITGNFSSLNTSNPNVPSGTVVDNFYPADPLNPGAVRNSIDWLEPPLFPVDTGNQITVPNAGTIQNIGANRSDGAGDPEPELLKPAFAMFFQTVEAGSTTFRQTFANPNAVPVGLFGKSEALTSSEIEFGQLTVFVVRNLDAIDDPSTVSEDSGFTNIDVLLNDTTIINPPAGNFSITATTNPTNGTINIVTVNGRQQIAYRPNPQYFGPDSFTYTIRNQNTPIADSDTATVNITVTPINDAPVANPDNNVTAVEDTPREINANELLSNDTPGPGESDTFAIFDVESVSTGASVSLNASGNVNFTPNQDFNGQYRFRYRIKETGAQGLISNYATVLVTVAAVNDAPIATNDSVANAVEDIERTIAISSLLSNDLPGPATATDEQRPNQDVTLLLNSLPATTVNGGTLQVVGGNIIYKSAKDYSGADSFTYSIQDTATPPLSAATPATVSFTVVADNDPPEANDDLDITIDEFTTDNELDVLANDNPGSGETQSDSITIQSFTQPANGSVKLGVVGGKQMLLYTPNNDYIGADSFNYTIVDTGGKTDTALVTIDVVPVIRPRARLDRYSPAEDVDNFVMNVMSNDLANVGNFKTTLLSFTAASNGTVTLNNNNTPSDLTDDFLLYTPNDDYFGPDSFTYTINDTKGTGDNSTATVSITVTEVNDAPTATGNNLTSAEDDVYTIVSSALLSDDSVGPDNEKPIQTLSIFSVQAVSSGGTVELVNGNVVYRPTQFFNGPFVFSYIARDNGRTDGRNDPLNSNSALVTIAVSEKNNAPIAGNDNVNVTEDIDISVPLTNWTSNDRPAPVGATDEQSQTLTVTTGTFTTARGGTVVINNTTATYSPPDDFNGVDTFTYEITDNGTTNGALDPKKATAVVTFTVSEVNDAPTAVNDDVIAYKNFPMVYEPEKFLNNDIKGPQNESGQTLTIVEVFALTSTKGTVRLNTDGTVSYTPSTDYVGEDFFGYRIRDNGTTAGAPAPLESTGVVRVDVKDFIPSTISGIVYIEETGDLDIDSDERFLGGVAVRLTGTALGEPVNLTTYTLADGSYRFPNLAPGNYQVVFAPPANMVDGADIAGNYGDADNLNNQFSINIAPPGNIQASNYNFALNGISLQYALQLDSLASPYYSRDPSLRTHGMFGLIRPGNNFGWAAAMEGFDQAAYAEMVLSSDGTRLVLSVVDRNEQIFTAVLGRGQFVKTNDNAGNVMIRVLGGYSKFTWNRVAVTALPPVTAARYLDSVEAIFAQEDWDGIAGN
jgi:hypothetical protein